MKFTPATRVSGLRGSAIREMFKKMADPNMISMAGGNPSPDLFPNGELAAIAEEMLTKEKVKSLQYGLTEGYTPLREKVREMLSERESIGRDFDDLIIVSGGQQGIDLLSRITLNEGDAVIVEEPSFIGALNAFRSYGARLIGVPMEKDGMSMEALKKTLNETKNVKLLYTIPSFQNPSGTTMSEEKRREVYRLCREHDVIIIEDNPYGELTYTGKKLPTIKSIDEDGSVVYCGSFSKILSPGLRVGFMMGHKDIIAKAIVAKQSNDVHTSMLPQLLTYEFLCRYRIDDYIEKIRAFYAKKCALMLRSIDEHFPKEISHTVPTGGIFLWCTLPEYVDMLSVTQKATEALVAIVPGNTFAVDIDAPSHGFRLNFSTPSDEDIIKGIRRLGKVLHDAISEKK